MDSSLLAHRDSRDICCTAVVYGLASAYTLFATLDQAPDVCLSRVIAHDPTMARVPLAAPRQYTRRAQRYRRVRLLSVDVQIAILQGRTVAGGICTRKVTVVVFVEVGHNRK